MFELLGRPWPWYIGGPLIGLMVPLLLWLGNRDFGISGNFRHLCAAVLPRDIAHFRYDWKRSGAWSLLFALGIIGGGVLAGVVFANPEPIALSERTVAALAALGITDFTGLVPADLFAWGALGTAAGWIALVGGGFLVGFGTAYAGGCTSGHAITGLAALQKPSLLAVLGFFAGGLFATYVLLPLVL
jgi:uncharacterized protein